MSEESTAVVRHEPEAHRFVIEDGGKLAGFTEYRESSDGTVYNFVHTVVDPEFSGRGLAGMLVSTALEQTRGAGKTIVPTCPFVAAWLKRHPTFIAEVDWPAS